LGRLGRERVLWFLLLRRNKPKGLGLSSFGHRGERDIMLRKSLELNAEIRSRA